MTATPNFLNRELLRKIFVTGIFLLVVALPLSKFAISVAQFMILGSWMLSGDLPEKFKKFFRCTPALLMVLLWVIHAIGIIYSSDLDYALKDLRIKLPLLALPIIFSSVTPLTTSQFEKVLLGLIAGVAVAALLGFITWMGWTGKQVVDVRDISLFVSHIRLSLLICLGILVSLWFIAVKHKYVVALVPTALFLFVFLLILESLTGLVILSLVLMILGIRRSLYLQSPYWKWMMVLVSLCVPLVLAAMVISVSKDFRTKEQVDFSSLSPTTPSGNTYMHYADLNDYENGKRVWIYVCEEELEQQWNKRSSFEYKGNDKRGQELRFTLIRYMTSKGLRKDSAGVWALNAEDIAAVEKGIANVHYTGRSSLYGRIHQVLWEIEQYREGGDPSGHSLTMRWEYWKTAMNIIKDHPVTGVGTGDVPAAFREQYIHDRSRLEEKWRLRAHNQYLSLGVAFGIPGILFFAFVLLYVLRERIRQQDTLFIGFWLIAVISMLTEDTLETQAGVTFFALFYCLFLFINPQKRACDGNIGS
jgi:hypothetical protein